MRPANLIYGVSEKPPAHVCLLSSIQLLTNIAPTLIYPILMLRATGASEQVVAQIISLSFLALGAGTVLQALTPKWIGSGYLIPTSPAAAYVPVGIIAIKSGGMPLLMGMTLVAGLFEIAFAQFIRRLRPFFPTEISGLCILLIGILLGVAGLRALFGLDVTGNATATAQEIALSAVTLALMIGLNLWGKGTLRMFCAVIGVAIGYVAGILLGVADPHAVEMLTASRLFALPHWDPHVPTFSPSLVIPFMAAALTCALRTMGDVTTAQKINDQDWIRPNMTSIRNGIVANGAATIVAAFAGGIGGNTLSSGIGMSNATGVTSRKVGYWLGGLLIMLSAFPIASAIVIATPRPVMSALILFTSCFIIVSGLQVITSRLLDLRRTYVIGLALTFSLSHDLFPELYEHAPAWLQPFTSSGLAIGLVSALILNAVFRLGVKSRASVTVTPGADAHDLIRAFLEQQGARWGARRDVIERAIFGTAQAVETIIEHCNVEGVITVEASFDEFNLNIRTSYRGEQLALEDRRPTDDEIRDTEGGIRRLAGFLLQRNADRVRTSDKDGRSILEFHFQH